MIYKEILPSLGLQPFIKNYLLVGYDKPLPVDFVTQPYPTRIEQSLNFFAKGFIYNHTPYTGESVRVSQTAIFGQQVLRLNFETHFQPDFLMLMVVFQAGALNRILGISSQELTTQFCDAEPLLSVELRQVRFDCQCQGRKRNHWYCRRVFVAESKTSKNRSQWHRPHWGVTDPTSPSFFVGLACRPSLP
jgi:hypothetical protein